MCLNRKLEIENSLKAIYVFLFFFCHPSITRVNGSCCCSVFKKILRSFGSLKLYLCKLFDVPRNYAYQYRKQEDKMREERIEENQGNTKNTKEQNRMANPIFWSIIWFYYFCLTWILFGTFLQYQVTLFLSWSSVSQGWLKQLSFDSWSSKV